MSYSHLQKHTILFNIESDDIVVIFSILPCLFFFWIIVGIKIFLNDLSHTLLSNVWTTNYTQKRTCFNKSSEQFPFDIFQFRKCYSLELGTLRALFFLYYLSPVKSFIKRNVKNTPFFCYQNCIFIMSFYSRTVLLNQIII